MGQLPPHLWIYNLYFKVCHFALTSNILIKLSLQQKMYRTCFKVMDETKCFSIFVVETNFGEILQSSNFSWPVSGVIIPDPWSVSPGHSDDHVHAVHGVELAPGCERGHTFALDLRLGHTLLFGFRVCLRLWFSCWYKKCNFSFWMICKIINIV